MRIELPTLILSREITERHELFLKSCYSDRAIKHFTMNDPGLDSPIKDGAKAVEEEHRDEADLEEEDEQAFLNPRWRALPNQYEHV